MTMTCAEVIGILESKRNQANIDGMARFGIRSDNVLGLGMGDILAVAKRTGRDHDLALELWATGIYEARILAARIDEPKKVTREQMENWALDFDNWAVCDNACMHLFDRTACAWDLPPDWCRRREEFVRRAGFAIIASLTIHDKKAEDKRFVALLPLVKQASPDERPIVMKAVSWALRQIGKRSADLNAAAISEARQVKALPSKSARWIAADALRELESEKVQERLKEKAMKAKR